LLLIKPRKSTRTNSAGPTWCRLPRSAAATYPSSARTISTSACRTHHHAGTASPRRRAALRRCAAPDPYGPALAPADPRHRRRQELYHPVALAGHAETWDAARSDGEAVIADQCLTVH
jgi:hypothetical protein